jgi:hypothetical protein
VWLGFAMLPSRMQRSDEVVFVVNPRSGGRSGRSLVERLRRRVGEARVQVIGTVDLRALARAMIWPVMPERR